MGEALLTVKNLNAWYNVDSEKTLSQLLIPCTLKRAKSRYNNEKRILLDFSFALDEHEVAGLIGLNGAGKTTFLKVLSGLLPTFRSEGIFFCGAPVDFRNQDFKRCRYTVFAEDNSFSYFTFREYLAYVCAAYGKEVPNVSELIQGFHFEEYTDTLLRELSTGNRKKAFLITAFALKPRLLLLDEPVNGLDFQSTEYLYRQISGYKEHGTVLFSSHILESITLTSDRVFVLENGRIRQTFERGQINAEDIREALHDENDR